MFAEPPLAELAETEEAVSTWFSLRGCCCCLEGEARPRDVARARRVEMGSSSTWREEK